MDMQNRNGAIDTAQPSASMPSQSRREVIIIHTFDAPPERVFGWWTEPALLMRWWAPKGWSTPSCKVDLHPGGIFHYCMRSPEGNDFWGRGVYREIAAPQRLVYTDSFSNEEGNMVDPARYGMSYGYPSETQVTVVFSGQEGKTRVAVLHDVPEEIPERTGMQQGWAEMLERLDNELAATATHTEVAEKEVIFSRLIAAPRARVFKAWTDAAQLAQWWGPHGFSCICEMDARPGGSYRVVMRSKDGVEYPLNGIYREIVEPERLVMTDNWAEHPAEWQELLKKNLRQVDGEPAQESLNTVTFEEQGGKTALTIRTRFDSNVVRDAMLKMGMAEGWTQSLDRLEALLG
ncbi:hypothetical protein FGKAn22_20880 [Ferrigenium kumadai]|uniref:Activator of Hsp90 ATPase homologue 1/2-like C-terminal domain-containing protein n=1 Tax=Ferrigenium kumadai TaxID=1682490 RepID=A0AAN1T1N2_9PROT|nr:SRPBCC domain-containing protein [Ferrigenium kumadai]BBJ00396.1 hypothetical protein FGKAn22_20880 [Ferrigenium kumadai]